ncbi:acyl-coenzyme A diphosphatase NUDT19-like [Rhopilema esculentum]|uniref:acyl-coenzyme A diphosphatase NUDT19-like n=1 Tax=Rhopilema esculentum TaxID=499914 RepID=UPI0031DD7B94
MSKLPKKLWRDAATVIVAAKNASVLQFCQSQRRTEQLNNYNSKTNDYSLLMLKRHSQSNFMANRFVFPGGVIDKADYCDQWIDIFGAQGHSRNELFELYKNVAKRPPMFEAYHCMQVIPDIAFRICAAREAFEECGLMLFKANRKKIEGLLSHEEVLIWRKKVHNDAFAFLDLCRQFNVVPDIWSLKEWSCWLTPVVLERRFDTMFYIYATDNKPAIDYDEKEMSDAIWRTPKDLLCDHIGGTLQLPVPQIYELTRLGQFLTLEELAEFSLQRECLGTERNLPIRVKFNNGFMSISPGDHFYTTDPVEFENRICAKHGPVSGKNPYKVDLRLEDLQILENVHRMEFKSLNDFRITCNHRRHGHKSIDFASEDFIRAKEVSSKL